MSMKALRRSRIDLDQRPFIVIWEATRACALACQHCRATAVPTRDPRELSTAQACALMDDIAGFGTPPPFFVITGGDPFERPDLFELVTYGSSIGLPVAVSPSGTEALNRDNLVRLYEAGAHAISLSIDGASAATHDAFRGVAGSYDLTIRGWQQARDVGLRVQVNTTVTPGNLRELPDILARIHEMGVMTWSVFFLVPTGRGQLLPQLSAEQAEDVLNFCYDADKVVSLKTTEAPSFRRVCVQRIVCERNGLDPVAELGLGADYQFLRERLSALNITARGDGLRRPPLKVSAARGFVFISHTGDVYPSGFLPNPAGNVHRQPLADIYRCSDLFVTLRDPDAPPGRCGRCEFRQVCGGSRPRAFGATGDLLADDPLCAYVPGSFGHSEQVAALLATGV
ncbi:MAG TPA: TIGR04053 family radical SAM/SPASM domain-containing protein [Actinomycetota bacterium]|nr:TIGR04053 family radical SAM/SPASM domain-containing protein [Actinomycetota bacterium]